MKKLITIALIVLSVTTSFAQFGALDLRLGGTGGADRLETLERLNENNRLIELLYDNKSPYLEARYIRYHPISLSSYFSWGLGYARNITEISLETTIPGEPGSGPFGTNTVTRSNLTIRREHFVILPLKVYKDFPFQKQSNQRDSELVTSHKLLSWGGVRLGVGANFYYSFLKPTIKQSGDSEDTGVNNEVLSIGNALSDNLTKFIIAPELSVDLLFNKEFSVGFGVNYYIQSRVKDLTIPYSLGDANEEFGEFEFQDDAFLSDGYLNIFLSVKFR